MIRFLFYVVIAIALTWCGATVKLGQRTFFGHVKAVWSTDEAQDMKKGVEQGSKPVLEKVKRGVEAGYREATRDQPLTTEPVRTRDDLERAVDKTKARSQIDPDDVYVAPPDAGVKSRAKRRSTSE